MATRPTRPISQAESVAASGFKSGKPYGDRTGLGFDTQQTSKEGTGKADQPGYTYKNKLQEYTQKARLPLPQYETVMQGPSHSPVFMSRVCVNGVAYLSARGFIHLKSAEQDAARVALSSIPPLPPPLPPQENVKEDKCLDVREFINEDTTFCKTILNEYAAKKRIEKPVYATIDTGGKFPAFSSSMVLDGITYNGHVGRNKKEAEQLSARAGILFILDSVNGEVISEIIKSKLNLHGSINGLKGASSGLNAVPIVNVENRLDFDMNKRKQDGVTDVGSSSGTSFSTPNVPSIIQTAPPYVHEFKKPKVEANLATSTPLITFVPSSSGVAQNHWKNEKSNKG